MLYGIFSDIHGNKIALEAVFRSMESRGVERRVCLGDVVGYGSFPNECAGLVKSYSDICIIGNHDSAALQRESYADFNVYARQAIEWTQERLSEDTRDYLRKLPYISEDPKFTFVHASPAYPEKWPYVTDLDDALQAFACYTTPYCFIGHTHSPVIVAMNKNNTEEMPKVLDGPLYRPLQNEQILVNVGSVGQPRDRDPRACWCLMDGDGNWIEIVRVEYDIEAAQNAMRLEGLPAFLIDRLSIGR